LPPLRPARVTGSLPHQDEKLTASGFTTEQAEAQVAILSDALAANLDDLATKRDLKELEIKIESRLEKELSPLRADMAVAKWMLGIIVAGEIMLVLKAFFPT